MAVFLVGVQIVQLPHGSGGEMGGKKNRSKKSVVPPTPATPATLATTATPSGTADVDDSFRAGDTVELHGLKTAAFNGQRGTVAERVLAIEAENSRFAPPPKPCAAGLVNKTATTRAPDIRDFFGSTAAPSPPCSAAMPARVDAADEMVEDYEAAVARDDYLDMLWITDAIMAASVNTALPRWTPSDCARLLAAAARGGAPAAVARAAAPRTTASSEAADVSDSLDRRVQCARNHATMAKVACTRFGHDAASVLSVVDALGDEGDDVLRGLIALASAPAAGHDTLGPRGEPSVHTIGWLAVGALLPFAPCGDDAGDDHGTAAARVSARLVQVREAGRHDQRRRATKGGTPRGSHDADASSVLKDPLSNPNTKQNSLQAGLLDALAGYLGARAAAPERQLDTPAAGELLDAAAQRGSLEATLTEGDGALDVIPSLHPSAWAAAAGAQRAATAALSASVRKLAWQQVDLRGANAKFKRKRRLRLCLLWWRGAAPSRSGQRFFRSPQGAELGLVRGARGQGGRRDG